MKKTALFSTLLFLAPWVALAQTLQPIRNLIISVSNILGLLVPLLIAAALATFFWGLLVYIFKAGDEKAHTRGRNIMIAGIVSLFIMVSIWGIVALVQNALGVSGNVIPTIPAIPHG